MDLFDVYGSRSDDDDDNDEVVKDRGAQEQGDQPAASSDAATEPAQPDTSPDEPVVERTTGRLDSQPTDELLPQLQEELDTEFTRLRPYTRTGGRTTPDITLGLESLIVTCAHNPGQPEQLRSEHIELCRLCETTTSLAEISAHLRLPIGVTRILVSDAIKAGLVELVTSPVVSDRPSIHLMERVLHGLQHL